jgi:hypothetical protein
MLAVVRGVGGLGGVRFALERATVRDPPLQDAWERLRRI